MAASAIAMATAHPMAAIVSRPGRRQEGRAHAGSGSSVRVAATGRGAGADEMGG